MNKREPHQSTTDKDTHQPSRFPHYPRLFSAAHIPRILGGIGKTFLWLILILSILTSLTATDQALTIPSADKTKAILGASDSLAAEHAAVQNRYDYWQNVIRNHPDYRDGYYMVAVLAFQRGNISESRMHLNKVKVLDPNYPGIAPLEPLLTEE